jgi:hypothetical protein
MISVTSASYIKDFKIEIVLSNRNTGIFDLSPYLGKGIFTQLKNEEYAKLVQINFAGICWPNGQDFSADTIEFEMQQLKKASNNHE